jgi:O-antigen/teichoic acid export membrane protein
MGMDQHTREVVTKSSTSLLVRVLGMIATLLVSVCLGRTLGASNFGIINLALQTATLLLVVTVAGMDNVLIKRIAIGYERGDSEEIASSIYTSYIINGVLSGSATVLGILLAPWAARYVFHTQAIEIPLIISVAVLIPQTMSRVFGSGLNGFRRIWQSGLVDNVLSIWVVGIGLLALYLLHLPITVITVAILYAVGRLTVCVSIGIYWNKLFRYSGPRRFIPRPMLTMAMPLLVSSGAYLIASNADSVMLGWLKTPYEVGLYNVAARLALVESLFLLVSNAAIAPKLASLYSEGRIKEMERMVKRVTGGLILVAIVSLLLFMAFGHSMLAMWGKEFAGAYLILIVLGIGQFFNISTGCSGMLLIMCGYEKSQGYISAVALFVNLILNYFLISTWGAVGAALATAITVAGANAAKMFVARRKIGVLTFPFLNI